MTIDFCGKDGSPFITTIEAARILKLSPRTLEKLRQRGEGPEYFKIGNRVFYTNQTVGVWSVSKVRKSTFDPPGDHPEPGVTSGPGKDPDNPRA